MGSKNPSHRVNFEEPRSFGSTFKSNCKEIFFPDDPFRQFRNESTAFGKTKKAAQYFIPILDWLPNYKFRLFRYDLLAGITITTLAIPQGISYAKLANLPPIIGLYCSFVPPLVYAVFGSSKHVAIGNVAACSLLISDMLGSQVENVDDNSQLYMNLVFTATFFTGIFETLMGLLRLGFVVDFLSHSTITGFMAGTATLICLQQLKGMLGLNHFTHKTDVVSVLRSVFENKKEKKRKPKLFWVSAIAPMVLIVIGCLFAYFAHAEKHGIQIVGHLHRGLSPVSIQDLNFDPKYLPSTIKTGLVTGLVSLSVTT
ncbi:sulfate transporter 3 1 [Euphorbia peplus]|nr:sulfate transporter 3 1 [Euphorbia peplus]